MTQRLSHMNSTLRFALMAGTMALFSSCGSSEGTVPDGITEGTIVFEVTYPDMEPDNVMLTMLPEELEMKFKDNKIKSTFKAAAGIVELDIISDANTYTLMNTVKLFGDRYVLKTDKNSGYKVGRVFADLTVKESEERADLAGVSVQKCQLSDKDGQLNSDVWVTSHLNIKDPNWFTGYEKVTTMLMDYTVEQYGIVMHLKAKSISADPISDEEFVIHPDCKELSQKEFDELILSNMALMLSE